MTCVSVAYTLYIQGLVGTIRQGRVVCKFSKNYRNTCDLSMFQALFEPMFIAVYNLFYTSQPVLALGIFDQDVDEETSLKFPKLYTPGLESSSFNKQEFFRSALQGFLTSCVLFFLSYGAYGDKVMQNGQTLSDHQLFGTVIATCLVIVVNLQVLIQSQDYKHDTAFIPVKMKIQQNFLLNP